MRKMKIDDALLKQYRSTAKENMMRYHAFIKHDDLEDVFASMRSNGYKPIIENQFMLIFAKFNKELRVLQVTTCEFED